MLNPLVTLATKVQRLMKGDLGAGDAAWKANDNYVSGAPSAQQTIDIFAGDWASDLPIPGTTSGSAQLFADDRIQWMLERLGNIAGWNVLELGPLEGGHTTMLEQAGAASIEAIDANKAAYLKCLIVQQLLGLKAARFMLGDFDAYLAQSQRRFDLLVASGILYHMKDPLQTLLDCVRISDRVFIWSHFMDEAAMPAGDRRRRPFTGEQSRRTIGDASLTYHVRSYLGSHRESNFCGGTMSRAIWLDKHEVLDFFQARGFVVETAFEEPNAPNGPALCLLAQRA